MLRSFILYFFILFFFYSFFCLNAYLFVFLVPLNYYIKGTINSALLLLLLLLLLLASKRFLRMDKRSLSMSIVMGVKVMG